MKKCSTKKIFISQTCQQKRKMSQFIGLTCNRKQLNMFYWLSYNFLNFIFSATISCSLRDGSNALKMKSCIDNTESCVVILGANLRSKVNLQSKRLSRFPNCRKTTLLSIKENETGVNKIGAKTDFLIISSL